MRWIDPRQALPFVDFHGDMPFPVGGDCAINHPTVIEFTGIRKLHISRGGESADRKIHRRIISGGVATHVGMPLHLRCAASTRGGEETGKRDARQGKRR